MKTRSLKINSLLNAFRMLLTVIVPLLTFPYLSRVFLAEGCGVVNFVTSTIQFFTILASLGIYNYGLREGARLRTNRFKFSKFASELFFINTISTFFSYCLFFLILFFFTEFSNYYELLLINCISIAAVSLGLDWVFSVYEDYTYITLRQIVIQIFSIFSMFIFVHNSSDIKVWIVILTLSSVVSNAYNIYYALSFFSFTKVKISDLTKHLKPIFILFTITVASSVYSYIDVVILGLMSSNQNVGLYSAAVKIISIIIVFLSAMSPVFVPKIMQSISSENETLFLSLVKKILLANLSIAIPSVVGLMMVGRALIFLIAGESFNNAVYALLILSPLIIITSCSNILYYNVLVPRNREFTVLKCIVVGALINIGFSFILIPFFKEKGVAIACLIAELASFFFAFYSCYNLYSLFFITIKDIKNYLFGSLSIIAVCFVVRILFSDYIYVFILSTFFSSIFYFLILLFLKDYIGIEMWRLICSIYRKACGLF